MKSRKIYFGLLVLVAALSGMAHAAYFQEVDVFTRPADGYNCFRIPSIIAAPNGDLLAFCEGRKNDCGDGGDVDILMKRSTDNGQTWGSLEVIFDEGFDKPITIGNPCPVVDEITGRIWMLMCRNVRRVYLGYSDDNGASWWMYKELSFTVIPPHSEGRHYATGPGIGIQLRKAPYAGRLVIPCDHDYGSAEGMHSHMIYSDDHGETWTYSGCIGPMSDECQVVELSDGTLLMNSRRTKPVGEGPPYRGIATSGDGGQTWSEVTSDTSLPDSVSSDGCQGSILRYMPSDSGDTRVLFSNPADAVSRVNMTVRLSYDECETWPVSKQVYSGFSAYSCLVMIPDGKIGCFYEKGPGQYQRITLARFDMDWLTSP